MWRVCHCHQHQLGFLKARWCSEFFVTTQLSRHFGVVWSSTCSYDQLCIFRLKSVKCVLQRATQPRLQFTSFHVHAFLLLSQSQSFVKLLFWNFTSLSRTFLFTLCRASRASLAPAINMAVGCQSRSCFTQVKQRRKYQHIQHVTVHDSRS